MTHFSDYKDFFDLNEIIEKIKLYLIDFDEELFVKAFNFAADAHKGQLRKDKKTPYIVHPVSAVDILADLHADIDVLIAALLHDVPEDTEKTIDDVQELFGEEVAFLVEGITKLSAVRYMHEMTDSKIESLKKLFIHTAKDPRVVIIKLADRLHNMRTLVNVPPENRVRTARETLEIFVPTANLLGIQFLKYKLEELCFRYLYPTEHQSLQDNVEKESIKYEPSISRFKISIENVLAANSIEAKVWSSEKSLFGIYKKTSELGRGLDYIDDRVLINIAVNEVSDAYRVLGLIHSIYLPKTDKFRDFIANPKVNGYKALHTVVFGIKGVMTEVRIFTENMRIEAEYGIAAHFFKNPDIKGIKEDIRSLWLDKIIDIEKKGTGFEFLDTMKTDILEERIIVFTPKGAKIDLPRGASAIDFAYALGSNIGNKADRASVNGVIKSLTTALKSGDVVKIVTSVKSVPELYWLNFSKTNFARNKIKSFFKKLSKQKKAFTASRLLQKEFDILALGPLSDMRFSRINKAIKKEYNKAYSSWSDVFSAITSGEIKANSIAKAIKLASFTESSSIFKFLSPKEKDTKFVRLRIVASDRRKLTNDIVSIVDRNSVEVRYMKGNRSMFSKYAYFQINFFVSKFSEIGKIIYELRQVEGVKYVTRLQLRAVLLFYISLFFLALVWLSHSYLIKILIIESPLEIHPYLRYFLFYIELFLPVLSLLFLTTIIKKYFPVVRKKIYIWLSSFTLISLSFAFMFFKYRHLHVNVNYFVLSVGIISAYLYLFYQFIKTKKKLF